MVSERSADSSIMEKNLTSGSVFGNIVTFSLPYLFSYFLQTLYGMADLFIIGQFEGTASTTAVSIGSQVMHMLTVMIVGLAMGATVGIGRAIGGNQRKEAARMIGNTTVLFSGISVVLVGILLLLVHPIVGLISTPQEAVAGTVSYLVICFLGIPFITAYNVLSSVFRGMGDSKSPMYFVAVACVTNIGLDYLFMGAFHMGPAGAALGTTLAQVVSVCIAFAAIRKKNLGIPMKKEDFKPQGKIMGQLLQVGIPVALQDGLIQVAFIIITIIANRRGLDTAAAVGIVEKMISFVFLVPSSLLSTVSVLCAQNMGAGKYDRAKQTLGYAIVIAVCFGLFIGGVVQFAADGAVSLFSTDPAVIRLGGQYFRGYIWDCLFAGIHFSFSGYFCAYGKSVLSFIHNIIAIVCVRVPGVYLTSKLFPATLFPMGIATACGSLLSVIICLVAYAWLSKKDQKETVEV